MLKTRSLLIFSSLIVLIVFGLTLASPAKAATILSENFDNNYCYQGQQCSIPPPTGWYNGDGWWSLGRLCGTVYRGTGNYAASAFQGDPYSTPSTLVTKSLSMNSANSYTLTFYARVAGSCNYGPGTGKIGVYRTQNQEVTGTIIGSTSGYTLSTTWTPITISNFTVPSTGIWYIQFLVPSGTGDNSVIDEVVVSETAASDTAPPTVGQISPTSATVNVTTTFSTSVLDNVGVTSCNLYVDGVSQGAMSGSFPCTSCTASRSHTFTSAGTYAMYARCSDAAGNSTNGTSVNVNVTSAITVPTVTTGVSTMSFDRDNNQATLNGTVTNNGGATITYVRFMWGTSAGSYPNSSGDISCSGCTTFQWTKTGMSPGTTYYYKAQAYNSAGWSDLNSTSEKRVVIYIADGSQQTFNTCVCTTNTIGGCCNGCSYCPAGTVNNGSGLCVSPSATYYCGVQNSCTANSCSGTKYYLTCNGSGSCRTDTTGAYSQTIYASTGYVFDSSCNNNNSNLCGYSGYNKCGGVGSPYSCQKGRDQYRCNAGVCNYDVGDEWVNVSAGYVCSGGSEISANTTYYCGFSAYNGRSADKCEKKKDYLACNANVCNYGDYGDAYDNVSAYRISNTSGQEVDAASADNTGTCHACTEGSCSGYYRWGECDGSGNAIPCTYYQQEVVYAQTGYTLTSSCVTSGATNCTANQCRDGSGWHHLCSQRCDASHSCAYWVDSSCVDHCTNGVKDCDETALNCGGSCSSCTATLSVVKTGTGAGTVTSSPAGISCGSACSYSFNSGTSVTLTAAPSAGSYFAGWSGDCSGTGSCSLTMNSAKNVTATFHIITYTLSVTKQGTGAGTVTSNPSGISCGGTCSYSFNSGTVVTLAAVADSNSTFAGWSGSGCSGTGSCVVTMDAAKSVTATFNVSYYTLTTSNTGTGAGAVTSSPAGISCGADCSENYSPSTSVTLTATPSAGSYFAGWSGDCSGTGSCSLTMNSAKNVTATFHIITYTLSVTKQGTGAGAVTSSPSGISCGGTCSYSFNSGTVVTLAAVADSNSTFAGWSGGGCSGTGICTVVMDAAKTITATFSIYTPIFAPTVTTNSATTTSGVLRLFGTLTGFGSAEDCDIWFEWGTTTSSLNHKCFPSPKVIPNSISIPYDFSCDIAGFAPNATYYFVAKAQNSKSW